MENNQTESLKFIMYGFLGQFMSMVIFTVVGVVIFLVSGLSGDMGSRLLDYFGLRFFAGFVTALVPLMFPFVLDGLALFFLKKYNKLTRINFMVIRLLILYALVILVGSRYLMNGNGALYILMISIDTFFSTHWLWNVLLKRGEVAWRGEA